MALTTGPQSPSDERAWYIIGRWREYEGESRANLLRVIAVGAFYIVELANYHGFRLGVFEIPKVESVDRGFHLQVTALAVAWTMTALAVQICLRRQVFPGSLKYFSTAADIALLSCVLGVSNGPRSPVVVGYFLIVALAGLRFSLSLVRFATIGSMLGYLLLLGYARWFTSRQIGVPRYYEIMFLLALVLTGITLGQVLRRVPSIAVEFADRRAAKPVEGS